MSNMMLSVRQHSGNWKTMPRVGATRIIEEHEEVIVKIASIESIPLRIPFTAGGRSDEAVWGGAGRGRVDSLLVKVTTDTGVVGWGETSKNDALSEQGVNWGNRWPILRTRVKCMYVRRSPNMFCHPRTVRARLRAIFAALLLAYSTTHIMTAQADTPTTFPPQVISLQSRYDFQTTISRLKDALGAHGITVFADIDQRAAAESAGTTLRPTRLILFGNPKAGTPIMAANPHAALELPLRAVVWEDEQHAVHMDYQDVTATLGQYGVAPALFAPLKQMPVLLRQVVGQE